MKEIKRSYICLWLLLILFASIVMVQVSFASQINDNVQNMDTVNQDVSASKDISPKNNTVDLNQQSTENAIMSNSLNNGGFLVTEESDVAEVNDTRTESVQETLTKDSAAENDVVASTQDKAAESTDVSIQDVKATITFGSLTSENGKILVPWSINGVLEADDSFKIDMLNEVGEYLNTVTYSSEITSEVAQFEPLASGSFVFRAVLYRAKTSATVTAETTYNKFELPLEKPAVKATQNGSDSILLEWNAVSEATGYSVVYKIQGGAVFVTAVENTNKLQAVVSGLSAGKKYTFLVVALKNDIKNSSDEINIELVSELLESSEQETAAAPKVVSCYVNSLNNTSKQMYEYNFISNADGILNVTDKNGKIVVQNQDIEADVTFSTELKLVLGNNEFIAVFNPSKNQNLETYSNMMIKTTVEYKVYSQKIIYVTPDGTPDAKGTKNSPLDIYTACNYAKSGQIISLSGGIYKLNKELKIASGNNGTASDKKYLLADKNDRAVLDFLGSAGGFCLDGNYWCISNIDVCNTSDGVKGICVSGSYNILDRVEVYSNGDTGIQINGYSTDESEKWPSDNLILNCTAYNNCDISHVNADGFSVGAFRGENNIFRGCAAYSNAGDGFDLSDRTLSDSLDFVTIENCISYRNGQTVCRFCNTSVKGEGNGFKLGFASTRVENVLKNSIAFDNLSNGVTTNSNPGAIVENTISAFNGGSGFKLYGQITDLITLKASNDISYQNMQSDVVKLDSLLNESNFFDGKNSENELITADMFESVDYKNYTLSRLDDGSINMNGLFILTEKSPKDLKLAINTYDTPSKVVWENGSVKVNFDDEEKETSQETEQTESVSQSADSDFYSSEIDSIGQSDSGDTQNGENINVKKNFNPFTGDGSPLALMFGIAGISLAVVIILIVKKNKK